MPHSNAVQLEARAPLTAALAEQLHGLRRGDLVEAGGRAGHRQWGHRPRHLAGDGERLAAGRQAREPGAGARQAVSRVGAGIEHVLTRVEHEQPSVTADPDRRGVERI